MTFVPLRYLSEAKLAELRESISTNLNRYTESNFLDLEFDNGWAIESPDVEVNTDALLNMDGSQRTAEADIENSLIVHGAFKGMTPALAREERVWARITHIEALSYSRSRWLQGSSELELERSIRAHMFAPGLTGVRDDNAVARLWWNAHIAALADPVDPEGALRLLVKRADIRMQFVERSFTGGRRPLARAIVRAMRSDPWITSTEESFRDFMKTLNRDCGGVLFEALTDSEADQILHACRERAQGT